MTSRRAFSMGAGVFAATALAAAARADPATPATGAATAPGEGSAPGSPPAAAPTGAAPQAAASTEPTTPPDLSDSAPPPPNSPARARDLGKLYNVLYNNPDERALFIADPGAYAGRLGLRYISAADLAWFKNAFADGFCCMGCGC